MLSRWRKPAVKAGVKPKSGNPLTPSFLLTTLGSLSLSVDGAPALAGRRKLLVLLTYLARHPGRQFERAFLADLGWPDTPDSRGRASLRQALSELREALGPALVVDGELAGVAPSLVEVDADRFRALVDAGDHQGALQVWQGEFLPGADGIVNGELRSWLDTERESLRRRFAFAARAAVDACAARGAFLEAAALARRWSETLPLDGVAAVRWVNMLRLGGRSAEAESVASALTDRWRREFGVEPPSELVRTVVQPSGSADGDLPPALPMVARAAEFSVLSALWQQTSAGRWGVVLIEGEEGSGRSRLLSEFCNWVRESDGAALVLKTRAFEAEQERDWSTLRHLLPPLASAPGIAGVPPAALAAIAREVPEFGERYPAPAGATVPSMADAVARALADVAAEQPILVAIDDAHLADGPSRMLLEHLCRHPAAGTMLVIVTDPDVFPVADVAQQQGDVGVLHRIRLRRFNEIALRQLITGMGEFDVADATVLTDRLMTESGGNPLAATEFLAALAEGGILRADGAGVWRLVRPIGPEAIPVPVALGKRLATRVGRLDAEARATLEAAAALGREFDLESLRVVTRLPDERLDGALALLTHRRMVEAIPGGDRLRFTDDLLRRAVYDGLTPLRRTSLRARVRRLTGSAGAFGSLRLRVAAAVALVLVASAAVGVRYARGGRVRAVRIAPSTEIASAGSSELARAADAALYATLESVPGLALVRDARSPADVVLGVSIGAQGGELTVTGTRRSAAGDTLATEVVTGARENLAPLVATTAERLLKDHALPPAGFRISAARTAVPAALLKYFDAEQLARRFRMDEAAQAYFEAVQLDRGFAAAWHGLARVNGWFGLGDRMQRAEDSAAAHASPLSPRDRQVLAGWAAFANGRANSAEQIFRGVLGFAPDLVEAQVGLGEVLYHHNWMRGRDGLDSRAPWSAALRLDSLDWRAVAHASEVSARAGNNMEAARWLQRVQRSRGDTLLPADESLLVAALLDDSIAIERSLAGLDRTSDWALTTTTVELAQLALRPDLAERTAQRLVTPNHAREVRAFGWEVLSDLALARGHLREASRCLDSASALEPASASIARGLLLAAPFMQYSAQDDSTKREFASGLVHGEVPDVSHLFLFWFDYDRVRDSAVRPYLAALLQYQANAPNGRAGPPPRLQRVASSGDSVAMTSVLLAPSLLAWAALAAGDTTAALDAFRRGWEGVEFSEASFSAFMTRPWDVYKTGELLEARGDLTGAAAWYGNAGWVGLHDIAYVAPGQIRRGMLLERLGRRDEARAAYQRALRFWQTPDPEFRPLADSAAQRLAALTRGQAK